MNERPRLIFLEEIRDCAPSIQVDEFTYKTDADTGFITECGCKLHPIDGRQDEGGDIFDVITTFLLLDGTMKKCRKLTLTLLPLKLPAGETEVLADTVVEEALVQIFGRGLKEFTLTPIGPDTTPDLYGFKLCMSAMEYAKNTLVSLSLANLGLGDNPQHAKSICDVLRDNFVLQTLVLTGNKFSASDVAKIVKAAEDTNMPHRSVLLDGDDQVSRKEEEEEDESKRMYLVANVAGAEQMARGMFMAAREHPTADQERCDDWGLDSLADWEYMKYRPFFSRVDDTEVVARLTLVEKCMTLTSRTYCHIGDFDIHYVIGDDEGPAGYLTVTALVNTRSPVHQPSKNTVILLQTLLAAFGTICDQAGVSFSVINQQEEIQSYVEQQLLAEAGEDVRDIN